MDTIIFYYKAGRGQCLTPFERGMILLRIQNEYSDRKIAKELEVFMTTIGLEYHQGTPERKSNRGIPLYKVSRAQKKAHERRYGALKSILSSWCD